MTTQQVFTIGPSLEEDRPEIDFELRENSSCVDWTTTVDILDGTLERRSYHPPHLVVRDKEALDWDYYACAGTLGIMSQRTVTLLKPFGQQCFEFLEAFINGEKYFFLRQIGVIDALDRENSVGETFPHDTSRVMRFEHIAFLKTRVSDPCIFVIPEYRVRIFGTDTIARIIQENGLRGFRLIDSDSV